MWALVRRLRDARRDHHPDHPLHRRSRGDGRPHRHHHQGRADAGRGEGDVDAEARQAAADAATCRSRWRRSPPELAALAAGAQGATGTSWSTPSTPRDAASDIPSLLRRLGELGIGFKDLNTRPELARGDLREPGQRPAATRATAATIPRFNRHGVWAIYRFEMARFCRTLLQSVVTPVITTSLYFVVFGSAIGSRMSQVDGVPYGAFIVPGPDHAVAVHDQHLERVVRHLLPQVHGHDLRAAVGAHLVRRDDHRLRRRRRDQVDHAGAHHPRDGRVLRARAHRPPAVDGRPSCC